MTKTVSRLFRDPSDAKEAVKHLGSAGYEAKDIGVLSKSSATVKQVMAGKVGEVVLSGGERLAVVGCLAPALAKATAESKLSDVLAQALGVDTEAAEYFQFTLGAGGVLVAVQAGQARATEASAILGAAAGHPMKPVVVRRSGFAEAARMASTDPADAGMTGDFRRY